MVQIKGGELSVSILLMLLIFPEIITIWQPCFPKKLVLAPLDVPMMLDVLIKNKQTQ